MPNRKNTPVYFVGLNEISFEYVRHYCSEGKLKNLSKLLEDGHFYRTASETTDHLLEPWIQWVTVSTGLDHAEHNVFRLGDIVGRHDLEQIWEYLEKKGILVGAVSPFNAENRLVSPAFYVPDPWTKTSASGSKLLKMLSQTVSKAVNGNASSNVGAVDIIALLTSILVYSPFSEYKAYLGLILGIKKPGARAILLDQLLGHVFLSLTTKKNPGFASLFLNSGAHIQHHYLFSSAAYTGQNKNPEWYCPSGHDPLENVLCTYDKVVGKIMKTNSRIIIATGLHQVPHEKSTYYWRLKEHEKFLNRIGINYAKEIVPRMSRDFLIEFHNSADCARADTFLQNVRLGNRSEIVFSTDNRGDSLFVELVYSHDITAEDSITHPSEGLLYENFKEQVAFVALKNGEHNGEGYVLSNFDLNKDDVFPLRELRDIIVTSVLKS